MRLPVLIIDDDLDILEITHRWLRDNGFNDVITVSNTDDLENLANQYWSLVIVDVNIPGSDGLHIAETFKNKSPTTSVILITGDITTELTLKALNQQIDGFLPKPFDRSSFLDLVHKTTNLHIRTPRSTKERVLAIGAHPDDVEIGCGGSLLKHRDLGHTICILTLSPGHCGGEISIRYDEAYQAAEILGAELIVANLEDTRISEGSETISVINRVVEKFCPTSIYTHTLNDCHQDHRNTYRATIVAARGIENILCYQSPSSSISFSPTRFSDIGKSLIEKQKLISCYQSQREKCAYLSDSMIASTAEYWGRFFGYKKVEPLEIIKSS